MEQRRRHPRKDSGAELILAGRQHDIEDLSLRGLRVFTPESMEVGSKVPFALRLPGGPTLHGTAQVRWTDDAGWRKMHGLEIVQIGRFQRMTLAKYLNPRRFGALEALDLSLEFALALTLMLVARNVLSDPAWSAMAADMLPWAFMAGGVGLCGWFLQQA
ncbi:MAG: PilZ domain-containing protein [Elusimicrobia bacterium]|nr:PilZ domain-containing protein [Elusimicrobiota bacterium]